ncbi:GNAT family N-acetyltransferase [Pelagicoccus enzymogenes]|uniref:GNAT family N-acetyltransferase n=1 Tax=Pelagicoccus enzymogenes TaxID=2773457 RepID=UPI0028107C65|nr:GNAT family N-acetyltransferase [Pelagicoccus enzymogenes]MDQ8199785.1 GNAT family N-acetyltransferase [Pelagicoccus enzymogenes]
MHHETSIIEISRSEENRVFQQCAAIHIEQITGGFLTTLGSSVLTRVYKSIAASQHAFLIVAKQDDTIQGFICGCFDTGKLYRDVIRQNSLAFLAVGLKRVFSTKTLRKIWETLTYPKREQPQGIPTEEILNFCVSSKAQRLGIGTMLMQALAQRFLAGGVSAIRIVTGAGQKSANAFYKKIGAAKMHTFEVHQGRESFIYRLELPKIQ